MKSKQIQKRIFEKTDFSSNKLPEDECDNCHFAGCNFAGADLSDIVFSECMFTGCNFSMARLMKTTFDDVRFKDCKLLGMHFEDCNGFLFAAGFENCTLDLASFYKMKLKDTVFDNSSLRETDFTNADLTSASFSNCDLAGAIFENTLMEKADLKTAINYTIDPEKNRIRKALFSLAGLPGLLGKYDIVVTE